MVDKIAAFEMLEIVNRYTRSFVVQTAVRPAD